MRKVRILVADDHEVVRRGLRALLEAQTGWQVVGEAVTGPEAVDKVSELQPDVIILDINLPGFDGLEASSRIHENEPRTEILILTYHDSPFLVRKALESGIRGYVLKSDAGQDLLAAVSAVHQHKFFLSSKVSREPPREYRSAVRPPPEL
jgi:DNA-binding NarL/FixJ family response regulator